ncbi:MAG: ATP-binding protein [Polyangiaceae bacterium]
MHSATRPTAEAVLATLSAGVLVVGTDANVTFANLGAARMLRRSQEAIVGRAISDVLVPLDALLAADDPQGRRPRAEHEVKLGDGAKAVIGFTVSPQAGDGSRTVLFQEIGAILELRKQRDRLLQLAALGDALPSILHELRNPLAAVTTMLELLIEETEEAGRSDLHAILWEVRRLGLTLQGVGGIATEAQNARHSAIDLAVLEACRILEPTALRRGVQLTADVPTLPLVRLDRGVISGVVFNLVKNAIEACRSGDKIVVRARLDADDAFVLSVQDTGVGMSDEVAERCRDLFFTSKAHGSGIGLALCQRIADASGGALSIRTAQGAGTEISLTIPLRSQGPSTIVGG